MKQSFTFGKYQGFCSIKPRLNKNPRATVWDSISKSRLNLSLKIRLTIVGKQHAAHVTRGMTATTSGRQGVVSLTFRELYKIFSRNVRICKNLTLLWEFQAETLYVCPKQCLGYKYKDSAWNSHHKCDFLHCIFGEIILEGSQNVFETTPRAYQSSERANTYGDGHLGPV